MRQLRDLLAEFMIGWHQARREAHRRAELKWRARPPRPDVTVSFPRVSDKRDGSTP